jgi:hypothetical protein
MRYPQNVTLYQIFSWIRDVNKRLSELFKCKENNISFKIELVYETLLLFLTFLLFIYSLFL